MANKRLEEMLKHPERLTDEAHLRLARTLKWDLLLMTDAKEGVRLNSTIVDILQRAVTKWKAADEEAYEAALKRWGSMDKKSHKG